MKYNKFKIFVQILKNSGASKLLYGYIVFFAAVALVVFLFEPFIDTYEDAAWYCFVSCTTIGFGDFAAVTIVRRILTVVLYIYTIVILAIITAIITQFFFEIAKARRDESTSLFLSDLEHLPELSKERLEEISSKVKKMRK